MSRFGRTVRWLICGAVAATMGIALTPSSAAAATAFFDPDLYGTWATTDVAAEDLDGDGDDDLISAGGGDVAVHLSDGEGGFDEAAYYPVVNGGDDDWFALGDLNGDGNSDVVVSPRVWKKLYVLYGDGDGGFGAPVEAATTEYHAGRVAIGDFGGDGANDIAFLDGLADKVDLFIQAADGEFVAGASLQVGGEEPNRIEVADLNQDDRPDIVTSNFGSRDVSLLMQTAEGFAEPVTLGTVQRPRDLLVADVDGANGLDIVTADLPNDNVQADGGVSIFAATSPGQFAPRSFHNTPVSEWPESVEAADMDADGDTDLVVGLGFRIGVMVAGPGGSFETVTSSYLGFSKAGPALGKFDGDNELDAAVVAPDEGLLAVMFGDVLDLDFEWVNFGWTWAGTSQTAPIVVRNSGSQPAAPGAVVFEGPPGPFSADTGTCAGVTLAIGERCTIDVGFDAPAGVDGSFQAVLAVEGDTSTGPRYSLLEGLSVVKPAQPPFPIGLQRTPTSLMLTAPPNGESAPQTVTYFNPDPAVVNLGQTTVTGPFAIRGENCSRTVLRQSQRCSVTLVFRPAQTSTTSHRGLLSVGLGKPRTTLRGLVVSPSAPVSREPVLWRLRQILRPIGKAVRGGPRRKIRLPAFSATVTGRLSFRLVLQSAGRRVRIGRASARVVPGSSHSLAFALSKRGRALLRRNRVRRVTGTATFAPNAELEPFTVARRFVIRPPRRR